MRDDYRAAPAHKTRSELLAARKTNRILLNYAKFDDACPHMPEGAQRLYNGPQDQKDRCVWVWVWVCGCVCVCVSVRARAEESDCCGRIRAN